MFHPKLHIELSHIERYWELVSSMIDKQITWENCDYTLNSCKKMMELWENCERINSGEMYACASTYTS
jgi:hypothetical protein